ncbi:agmatine deiminase family protein [Helicobacter anatolicus]|uniref:agmatine deiminase family protein n=1 Tax=Helicobacter anatolicus TaxID=2905874 RepID=UPI001E4A6E6C|nr:agmatine deiminase family protein [Helicobacter anatolicus]MCE3039546.1 agmatine deiminase family protein [Helicobacter anatolicus]
MKTLPAEWEEQKAILMAFPHKNSDWNEYLDEARQTFLTIIQAILPHEKVILCVDPNDHEGLDFLHSHLSSSNLIILRIPTNDTWARDFGPISIKNDSKILHLDFGFNGWGLKFASCFDNQVSSTLFQQKILPNLLTQDLILEGGSIDSDGMGTLLTNTQCLLEKNRNPFYTQEELDTKLKDILGVERILWLHHGYLAGDDTDSHIDTLARFINPNTIAYIACNDKNDEHFTELNKMQEELKKLKTKEGKPYHLLPLPLPKVFFNKERLPASYANFLLINNKTLLLPIYNIPDLDTQAINTLKPYYEVIPIDCSVLIRQHGSLHCVTMQLYDIL